jgi:hypothetical protein
MSSQSSPLQPADLCKILGDLTNKLGTNKPSFGPNEATPQKRSLQLPGYQEQNNEGKFQMSFC